jgi:hypothetical protein
LRHPFRIARHHVGKPLEIKLAGVPRSLLIAVMASFLATAGVDARADNPVALVVEVVGETAPRLDLFSELSRNDRFDLIGGATV